MFISYMSNKNLQKKFDLAIKSFANKQPQTITYTPDYILKIVNDAFEYITNRSKYYNKNTKENIDAAKIKIMYDGFYSGYISLMNNPYFPLKEKKDLFTKKQKLDDYFIININNKTYNMTKIHKSVANRITLKN